MKKTFLFLLLTISASSFACTDLAGDYVCIDEYSYQYYRHFSIQAETLGDGTSGLSVLENGRNRYLRILRLDNQKRNIEDMKLQSRCDGKTLKVTMRLGHLSSTEKFKKTKTGMIVVTDEENGKKRLECVRK